VLPGESQHVPLEKYKTNLSTLVSFVRSPTSPYFSPDTKIIMITPPPIIETLFNEHLKAQLREQGQSAENMRASRRKEVTEKYAIACYDVAKEERLPVVDMHSSIIEAAGGEADDQLERFFT